MLRTKLSPGPEIQEPKPFTGSIEQQAVPEMAPQQAVPSDLHVKPFQPILLPDFEITDLVCSADREPHVKIRNNGNDYNGKLEIKVVAMEQWSGGFKFSEIYTCVDPATFPLSLSLAQGEEKVFSLKRQRTPGGSESFFRWPRPHFEHPFLAFFLYIDPERKVSERDRSNTTFGKEVKFPHVKIVSPDGGEIWNPNEQNTVRWESFGLQGHVRIEAQQFSWPTHDSDRDPLHVYTISDNAPNSGSFVFTTPDAKNFHWNQGFEGGYYNDGWVPGYYRIKVTSMDDPAVYDNSDRTFTFVGRGVPDCNTPLVYINPQNIYLAVTRESMIQPHNKEYTQISCTGQTAFTVPAGVDLRLEFKVPLEQLSTSAEIPATITITLGTDNAVRDAQLQSQYPGMFVKRKHVRVKQGPTDEYVKFVLTRTAFDLLDAANSPVTMEVVVSDSPRTESTQDGYLRFFEE